MRACTAALAQIAADTGQDEAMSALAHALGEVALLDGEPAEAATQFERAASLLADVSAPYERAETQRRAAAAFVAAGQHAEAVERLVAAHRIARKLGARPLAAKLAADLAALGERLDRRLGRLAAANSPNGGLTRREVDVVRLVAVGQTNREIARELFLSPRTVDTHVQNIRMKLGCRSRADAARRATSSASSRRHRRPDRGDTPPRSIRRFRGTEYAFLRMLVRAFDAVLKTTGHASGRYPASDRPALASARASPVPAGALGAMRTRRPKPGTRRRLHRDHHRHSGHRVRGDRPTSQHHRPGQRSPGREDYAAGKLNVGDGSGALSIDGTTTSREADPSALFRGLAFPSTGGRCVALATPPAGKALVLKSVALDTLAATNPGAGFAGFYLGASTVRKFRHGHQPTWARPDQPAVRARSRGARGAASMGRPASSIASEAFAFGYVTTASSVPLGSATTVSPKARSPQR